MEFPIYRKLDGFHRYYKLMSDRLFQEVYPQGGNLVRNEIEATQFPEIVRIQDMIDCAFSFTPMTAEEITQYFPVEG
jgi:hypothetical protein